MSRDWKYEVIRTCFLFSGADSATVDRIAGTCHLHRHRKGETLFLMGDPADGLHILRNGLVRIWIADEAGKELTLTLLEPGDPLGEIALLDGLPRTANATALEAGESLFLPRDSFDAVMEEEPKFSRHVIQLLCEILRRNTETIGAFAFRNLDARLARTLAELATAHGAADGRSVRLTRKFSQTDLAQMLGVTREAVNKRLMAMAHDGALRLEEGHIVVTDMAEIQARAEIRAGR